MKMFLRPHNEKVEASLESLMDPLALVQVRGKCKVTIIRSVYHTLRSILVYETYLKKSRLSF